MKLGKFIDIDFQLGLAIIVAVTAIVLVLTLGVPFYNSCKKQETISKLKLVNTSILQANRMYSIISAEAQGNYDMDMAADEFAKKYFTPYLSILSSCEDSQNACWSVPQYKDLTGKNYTDKISYSLVLNNNSVIGFSKSENGLISMIVDINGKNGKNKLGRDVFVFSFYNAENHPELCDESEYTKKYIKDGLHFGGYDKCGIPYNTYSYVDLYKTCNKKAFKSEDDLGIGSSCLALIQSGSWTIDKKYPW